MSQFKDNWTLNTGDLRGKNCFLAKRTITGLTVKNEGVEDVALTKDDTYTFVFNQVAERQTVTLPDATTCDNNWRVEIINLDENHDLRVIRYGNQANDDPYFELVPSQSQKTFILVDNSSSIGNWVYLKTSEVVLDTAQVNFVKYSTVNINYNKIAADAESKRQLLLTLPKGNALKSIKVKTRTAFDSNVAISVGTEDSPNLYINDYDLTTAVADDNFIKELLEATLSNDADKDVVATFTFETVPTVGNVDITLEYQAVFIPYRLSSANFTINQPLGTIFNYIFTDSVPNGYVRLDGSQIPNFQEKYPAFYEKLLLNPNSVISYYQWLNEFNSKKSCGKFAWNGTSLVVPAINGYVRGTQNPVESGQVILNTGNIFWQQSGKEDATIFYPYIMCIANSPQQVDPFIFGGEV